MALCRNEPHLIFPCVAVVNVTAAIPAVTNRAVAESVQKVSFIAKLRVVVQNIVVQDEDPTAAFTLRTCRVLNWRGLPSEDATNREAGIPAGGAEVEKLSLWMPVPSIERPPWQMHPSSGPALLLAR
jgi:hypothetical protein